jgi:cytochrome P450
MFAKRTSSFAGSDTTAIALRSIFYHLLKTPFVYTAALAEISKLNLSNPVTFTEGQSLTYIQACIKEGLRIHPAVGMLLERIVPEGGATFEGVFVPGGTIVGMNPWVIARDKKVYGEDAEDFRPERWIEATPAELKLMERNFLAVSFVLFHSYDCCILRVDFPSHLVQEARPWSMIEGVKILALF